MVVPTETTTTGCHVGLPNATCVYLLSINESVPMRSLVDTHNKHSAFRKSLLSFINLEFRLIADCRTRWSLGSIICLRFDNFQSNDIQNLEGSPRLCGYRRWDTLDLSHSERWWDATWISPIHELIFLVIGAVYFSWGSLCVHVSCW